MDTTAVADDDHASCRQHSRACRRRHDMRMQGCKPWGAGLFQRRRGDRWELRGAMEHSSTGGGRWWLVGWGRSTARS